MIQFYCGLFMILGRFYGVHTSTYDVITYTGSKAWSGTAASVYIILHGNGGKYGPVKLPSTASNFKLGSVDKFIVTADRNLGEITKLQIGHDGKGVGASWFLKKVVVKPKLSDGSSKFMVYRWLNYHEHAYPYITLHKVSEECGVPSKTTRIVNGNNSKRAQWPWQAQIKRYYGGSERHHCGGTLIHPQYILTAAHCVKDIKPIFLTVVLGEHDLSKNDGSEQKFYIEKVFQHPSYSSRSGDQDIAVLKLKKPVGLSTTIKLACLPEQNEMVATGTPCIATGWGTTYVGSKPADLLQQAILPVVGNKKCHAANKVIRPVTNNMICGGGNQKSGCHGDSGGPYVCLGRNGKYYVQGAVSWGSPKCDVINHYSVFARVSVYADWIESILYSS